MEISSAEQMDAIGRARKVERSRRLLDSARGHSWLRGRVLFLLQLMVILVWVFFSKGAPDQFVPFVFFVIVVVSAVEESVGRRIDALLELLDMTGALSAEAIDGERKTGAA